MVRLLGNIHQIGRVYLFSLALTTLGAIVYLPTISKYLI